MLKYRPQNDRMWDAWAVPHNGCYHLLHLQTRLSDGEPDPAGWGHAVSPDLIHWRECPPVLPPSGSENDRLYRYTGCTVEENGRFAAFSTRRNARGDQVIGVSFSSDLFHWNDRPDPVLTPDPALFLAAPAPGWGNTDCRDMTVLSLPGGGYCGYFAAVEAGGEHRGVIGAARSDDLIHWYNQQIVYRTADVSIVEMPEVFPFGNRYVLMFLTGQSYGRIWLHEPFLSRGTGLATADSPFGPFTESEPGELLLAGPPESGFSCRTVFAEGKRRALYVDPGCGDARLSLPKTVGADANGRPRLFYADDLCAALRQSPIPAALAHLPPSSFAWNIRGGDFRTTGSGLYGKTVGQSQQAALFSTAAPFWEITATLSCRAVRCGFVFYEADKNGKPINPYAARCVGITVEPDAGRIAVIRLPDGQPLAVRRWAVSASGGRLRVLLTDNTVEAYWNDELVITAGTPLPNACLPGCFVTGGEAAFDELGIWPLSRKETASG